MRPIRINAVSPGAVEETARLIDLPPLIRPVPLESVVYAYSRSVLGMESGRVLAAH
jgi:hypothetical protein